MIRWWLVRHAAVPGGRILGQRSDPDCDLFAVQEVAALAGWLPKSLPLVHSGMRRTVQTASLIEAAEVTFPTQEEAPDLREQDFGEWDGQSWAALAGADQAEDAALKAFWRAPGRTRPPGGESFAAMIDRVGESLRALSFRLDGQTEHDDVLAVVHAGTVRAALAVALALDPDAALRVMVAPLSLTRIDWLGPADTGGDPAWRVVGVNRVPP